jgi:6-pyruvoyltetrahydropterin/6-carboxytetrahydropterin synthase
MTVPREPGGDGEAGPRAQARRPVVEITHAFEFSASHRLHSAALSDQENRDVFGMCNNPHGHGHNYEVEVTLRGTPDPRTGMLMDLNVLSRLVRERIFERVDHKHLNHDVPFLEGLVTTAENLAIAFWGELEPILKDAPGCKLHRIRVRESRHNSAEYLGPQTRA